MTSKVHALVASPRGAGPQIGEGAANVRGLSEIEPLLRSWGSRGKLYEISPRNGGLTIGEIMNGLR
jgi:hypothetical protein